MRHKKLKISLLILLGILLISVISCGIYVSIYYHAEENVSQFLESDGEVTVVQKDNKMVIFEPENPEAGLIFYPGGKVEYTSYAPLLRKLAEQDILCILVKMPFNLAVLDINAADGLIDLYPDIDKWYIGGHSLGGSMAASYVASHTEEFDGLVLLAAYSTEDLSESGLKVLSLYGSEDGVLNLEKYKNYEENLPEDAKELVIEGGCHAWFGCYGEQKGDGKASISKEEQWEITAKFFKENVR